MPNCKKCGEINTNLHELSLLKFLLLTYRQAISRPPPWIYIFFHNGLLGGHTLLYSWAVFGLDNIILQDLIGIYIQANLRFQYLNLFHHLVSCACLEKQMKFCTKVKRKTDVGSISTWSSKNSVYMYCIECNMQHIYRYDNTINGKHTDKYMSVGSNI